MDIRINGKPLEAQLKYLKPGVTMDQAEQITGSDRGVKGIRDGFDTIGVTLADGQDVLILNRMNYMIEPDYHKITVNGKPAEVKFVESEVNTVSEQLSARYTNFGAAKTGATVAGAGGFAYGLVKYGPLTGLVYGTVTAMLGGVASLHMNIVTGVGQGLQRPNESVTDAIAH